VNLPAIDGQPSIGDLAELISLVTRASDQLTAEAETAIRDAKRSSEAAALVLVQLAADFELASDDSEHIVETAAARAEDAALDHRKALTDRDQFRQLAPAIAALRTARAALEERYLALADLSSALRDGAFPKWLTLRRSRSLLVHASRLLSEITAGRYAFADLDDEDSQWFVFDSDNGQPRSPASLSGGEKFVASLALALGMVEMMGRQGDRIESLFLDEGFGALDRTNLDAAIEALASVAATGRLVAVITHLRAVAEQIANVLSVTREPTGTQTGWLSDSARSVLAGGDFDVPSGLLE
jgi:exonuclease SbcC